MFDLRYHVASLAAVFLALVIGILVGVGLSGRGFVDDAERTNLDNQIRDLRTERAAVDALLDAAEQRARALQDYAAASYPSLVAGRLSGARVAIVFAGAADPTIDFAVRQAVEDAGGEVVRSTIVPLPLEGWAAEQPTRDERVLRGYVAGDGLGRLGGDLARELVTGGSTPLWDALARTTALERDGSSAAPVNAVVIAGTEPAEDDPAGELLGGLYSGLARSGSPAVGVEVTGTEDGTAPDFARHRLSTVGGVDTPVGKVALVTLLAGGRPGSYGISLDATDGVLPPLPADE